MSHKRIVNFEESKNNLKPEMEHVTPTKSLANLPRDFYESGFSYDAIIEMFDRLDESVNKAAINSNIPKYVKFWMPQECLDEILSVGMDMFVLGEPIILEYVCEPFDDIYNDPYSYMAAVSFFCIDLETGEVESEVSITFCRQSPDGTMQRIRESNLMWVDNEPLTKLSKLFDEDGHEAECCFLSELSAYVLSHPFAFADWTMEMLEKNKPIVKLYKRLDGLADFIFEPKNNVDDDIRVLLIPDDPYRKGGAIYYEKGQYHLCQYLPELDDLDAIDAELEDDDLYYTDSEGNPIIRNKALKGREYHADVFITDDATKIIRAARFMWDRYYNGDESIFTFPLSESAYAEGRRPYHRLRVYTYGGKRDLTFAEEGNMSKLRKKFGLKR